MKSQRPMFLDLTKIRFPVPAIVSILHRISGVVMFLGLPLLMYLLHQSLLSQAAFLQCQQLLQQPWMRLVMWVILSAVTYHFLAGVRHLIMDMGYLESLSAGRATAFTTLGLAVIAIIALGVWLWSI